jgi:DNA repair exonuclease SbcCD nuclease subunit
MTDTYEKLDIRMEKVDAVMHIADVHIRLTKRHDEYREVFSKVYENAKKLPQNSIILVAGDVVHSKVDLSPEAIQLASEFLKNLADARPVILIAGNHDCLLTNKSRLDSLSPIVDNLDHKNLFYLKDSKLYGAGNILFNNMSVFDDITRYIDIRKITKKIKNQFDTTVALFHGGIHGSMTDIGYLIENKIAPRDFFDGHDIVMLGDIHKAQTFYIEKRMILEEAEKFGFLPESTDWEVIDEKDSDLVLLRKKSSPIFRYPGSIIQQNHGEKLLGHGYSVWDIKTKTFDHVEIPNDYGYFTIEIHNGALVTDISEMPDKAKLRVKCKESVATEVKKVIAEIRQIKTITDLVYMRIDGDETRRQLNSQTIANLNQIGNISYQNKLIGEFLTDRYPEMDVETLKEVHAINKELNDGLSKDDQSKNIRWKPIKFEFSNMFSYGEGNVIDFTNLSDVYGLFASNASGKSSLMDALCFTIFDKSARAFKAAHVINTQKMSFSGKFTFEINKVQYVIERHGKRDKKNNVKVDVTFVKLENDEEVPLNAEARRSTNEIIRDFLGSYDDFVLTALALQGNQGSFIDMGQTQRKDLLSLFIGLTLFDRLVFAASNQCRDLSGAIKVFNKEDSTKRVLDMAEDVKMLEGRLVEIDENKESASEKIKELEDEIKDYQSKIVVLENVPLEVESLVSDRDNLIRGIDQKTTELKKIGVELDELKSEHKLLTDQLNSIDLGDLEEKFDEFTERTRDSVTLDRDLDRLRSSVKEKLRKLEHLAQHEYDPNCTFCMNNVFVKDAIATRESLDDDKLRARTLLEDASAAKNRVKELEPFVAQYKNANIVRANRSHVSGNLARKELSLNTTFSSLDRLKSRLDEVEKSIQLYERSKEVIETNRELMSDVKKLAADLQRANIQLKGFVSDHVTAYSKKVSLGDQMPNRLTLHTNIICQRSAVMVFHIKL